MDKEKEVELRRGFKNYLGVIMFITLLSIIIVGINYIAFNLGDEYKNIVYTYQIENILKEKNVDMPMPEYVKMDPYQSFDAGEFYANKSVAEFGSEVERYFVYNETYDCKYWTYNWAKWWTHNKDRLNLKMKYVTTDNHMFLMVYNESGYCTLDQDEYKCLWE